MLCNRSGSQVCKNMWRILCLFCFFFMALFCENVCWWFHNHACNCSESKPFAISTFLLSGGGSWCTRGEPRVGWWAMENIQNHVWVMNLLGLQLVASGIFNPNVHGLMDEPPWKIRVLFRILNLQDQFVSCSQACARTTSLQCWILCQAWDWVDSWRGFWFIVAQVDHNR